MYKYSHGGDIYSLGNKKVLDFSANINPFGLPAGVREAIINAAENADIYPDPLCEKLRSAISKMDGIPAENIFCGNGAADILYRIAAGLKPKKALLLAPSFSEYEAALVCAGCEISYAYADSDESFRLTEKFLQMLPGSFDIVCLGNPNNPTGHPIDKDLLDHLLAICERHGIIALIDECFIDFMNDSLERTVKNAVFQYKNLIVLKAFTKLFAMAGVRLGYCFCGNKALLEDLYHAGQPWGVSSIAQSAGIAATRENDYLATSLPVIRSECERLKNAMADMGFRVFDSQANFIFFKAGDKTDLKEDMLRDSILIRSCGDYRGLSAEYYRIAVKTPAENDILLKCLEKRRPIWKEG